MLRDNTLCVSFTVCFASIPQYKLIHSTSIHILLMEYIYLLKSEKVRFFTKVSTTIDRLLI